MLDLKYLNLRIKKRPATLDICIDFAIDEEAKNKRLKTHNHIILVVRRSDMRRKHLDDATCLEHGLCCPFVYDLQVFKNLFGVAHHPHYFQQGHLLTLGCGFPSCVMACVDQLPEALSSVIGD